MKQIKQTKQQLSEYAKTALSLYESGIISMAPMQMGEPSYEYAPRVHMDESIFFGFFTQDEIEVVDRGDGYAYEYEYQVIYEGVKFFCLSDELYEGFVA